MLFFLSRTVNISANSLTCCYSVSDPEYCSQWNDLLRINWSQVGKQGWSYWKEIKTKRATKIIKDLWLRWVRQRFPFIALISCWSFVRRHVNGFLKITWILWNMDFCNLLFFLSTGADWRMEREKRIAAVISIIQDASAPSEISPPLQRVNETREIQGQAKLLWVLQYLAVSFLPDVSWWEKISMVKQSSSHCMNFSSSVWDLYKGVFLYCAMFAYQVLRAAVV